MTSATIKNGEMLEIAARVNCDALIQIPFSHVDETSHTRRQTFELTRDRQAAKPAVGRPVQRGLDIGLSRRQLNSIALLAAARAQLCCLWIHDPSEFAILRVVGLVEHVTALFAQRFEKSCEIFDSIVDMKVDLLGAKWLASAEPTDQIVVPLPSA